LEAGFTWNRAQPAGAYVGWNLIVRDATGNVFAFPIVGNATSAAWTLQSAAYTVPPGSGSVQLYADSVVERHRNVLRLLDPAEIDFARPE
jgi:hypothetical protein